MSDLALRILLSAQDLASKVIKDVGGSLQSMGSSASGAGPGLAMAASGAMVVAGAILSCVQPAADFQSQLTNLVTAAGESKANLGLVSDGILKIAQDTGTATKDLTSSMFMIDSANIHGADSLKVLSAAAQGAKTDNADLTTVTMALTRVMTDYHLPASQAAAATNELIAAASAGQMHMQDLASSMGSVLPIAYNAKVSFADVGGALALMTLHGFSAQRASQNLAFALRSLEAPSGVAQKSMTAIGLKAQDLKDTLTTKGLPAALQLIEDHIGKKFPAGSVEATTALKNIMGGAAGLNVALTIGGAGMKDYKKNVDSINAALKAGGSSVEGWSEVQNTLNVKMQQAQEAVEVLRIKIGTALLPVITQIMGAITPLITGFSNFVDWLSKTNLLMPVLMGILAGCAALILAVVVPAVISLVASLSPFILVAAAVAAAIAGVVAAFIYFYNNSKPFKSFIDGAVIAVKNFAGVLWGDLQTALGFIGAFLKSTFMPVWQQLQDVWNTQILPSVHQLIDTFNQVKPQLTLIAQVVGVVLVVAFGLLVGAISGFVKGIAGFISGLIEAFGGIVQYITGVVQVISGIVAFIVDLFTGRFDKLSGDLGVIWTGIQNMFEGFGTAVKGIFDALIKGVEGEFSGFADGITGYFNQILHGADDKTKATADAVHKNTLDAKNKALTNVETMDLGTIQKYDHMRMKIEDQLQQTTNAVQKQTLLAKLKAVTNAEDEATQVWEKHKQMHTNVVNELNLMKNGIDTTTMSAADKAKANSLLLKDTIVNNAIATDTQTVAKFDHMRLGIIDELEHTHNDAQKHALEIQLTHVTHAEKTAIEVKKHHVQMRTGVESELDKLKSGASQKFGSIQKDVEKIVGAVGKWIQDKWHEAVTGVEKWFEHLYEHSHVFQQMVDDISHWITNVQNFLKGVWKLIVTEAQTQWNNLVRLAEDLWNKIAYPFIHAYDQYIQQPLAKFWKSVIDTAHTWQTDATNFGINLITGLANGITSAGKNVLQGALTGIASTVKFLIGWHSPTKEGPGSDSDKWAPNLVKMMSTGLVAGVPEIQNAVNKLAKPIALTLGMSNSAALNSLGGVNLKSSTPLAGGGSTTNNGGTTVQNFTININVPQGRIDRAGAKEIAKVVKDELSRELRGSGKFTTWTSGGAT